ncbi:hypothetical protein ABVT39_016262 [Epinephelus coioides]
MRCILCKPKHQEVLAFKNSPSHLRKHIKRKHERHLERYTKLAIQKRKQDEDPNDQAASSQLKLWDTPRVAQKGVDERLVDFVVNGLHPLSVVEEPGFQRLIKYLQPNASVMVRNTMKSRIDKATTEMKENLKVAMHDVEFIGTTTDYWTANRKGFIGVTAHWIQSTSLQRCSAALACKQLKGPHNFTALADALTKIHTEFNIRDKIVRTTTDSGSNFLKAFRVYGVDDENNAEPLGAEPDESADEESSVSVTDVTKAPRSQQTHGSFSPRPKRDWDKDPNVIRHGSLSTERKHERHLERYTKLAIQKRKHDEDPNDQAASSQLKLWDTPRVTQKGVDERLVDFVVNGLHPLSVVEEPGFQRLIKYLQPNAFVMVRNTMKSRIDKATTEMKENLKVAMHDVEFIGTTTDYWTANRKGFIGVTAHWIQSTSLQRCSAALACKQLKGPHNFTALADALTKIHTEFNIRDKIVRTTTDSGSNFLKAFRVYGVDDENNNAEPLGAEPDESGEQDGEEIMMEAVEAGPLLEQDDGLEYQLPKQHRCACHLMNLVATVDVKAANEDRVYMKLSRSTFAKCQVLWNKSGRSTPATEIIEEHCKLQLLRPCETRWNSFFYAVERIVRIVKEQGEAAIAAVFSALKIPT